MTVSTFFQRSELTRTLLQFKREFWVVGLFSFASNALTLAPSIYMLQVYDRVLISRNEFTLIAISLITIFFFALQTFSEWVRSRLLVRVSMRMDQLLQNRIFDATFESRISRLDTSAMRAFPDFIVLRQFLSGNGVFAFFDMPWSPVFLIVLFLMHPLLGSVATGGAILLAAMASLTDRLTHQSQQQASEAGSKANAFLQGKLRNHEVIEPMGMLGSLRQRWILRHKQHLLLNARTADSARRIQSLTKFIRYSLQSLILGAGALLAIRGVLTPAAMVVGSILMGRALAPVEQIIGTWKAFAAARDAFKRLEKLLENHPRKSYSPNELAPQGLLSVRQLSVGVPERPQPILDQIDLTFRPGEVVGIIGNSGSGKTTLARSLLGICPDIVDGEVRLDNQVLQEHDPDRLGRHIGYLPQEVKLFEGSVAENISRFGELDSAKVIAAAKLAGIHDSILRFPKGYDTPIGDNGNYLSGGQRQRIALARALYGDPAVLVLDEPNSSLDDAGEQALIATVQTLKEKGKTTVLITHRPNILNSVDRIVMLHAGKLQFDGTRQAFLEAIRPQNKNLVTA